jgi:hypothetical protein
MPVDSKDNDVSGAQFRPRAWFHCGHSPLGSVDFVEPNFCERSLEICAVVAQNRWAISPSEQSIVIRAASAPCAQKKELSAAAELFRFGPGEIQTAG